MPRKKTAEPKETSAKKKKTKEEHVISADESGRISKKEEINSALSRQIEEGQPQINIGLIGHVDHGKTTLTQKLSGKWTDTHSEEIKRGITIRLGYADAVFYKCLHCDEPDCFTTKKLCSNCNSETKAILKVSFVDAPGHESLMATMLSGANIMDGALLLVAADETCPQPQTKEHLMALQIINVKNIVVVQNKIDLVSSEQAKKNYEQIKALLKGTAYKNSPIIPISAKYNVNIDALLKSIYETVTVPTRDVNALPLMFVARSFDINKPGAKPDQLVGGVLGGALKQGVLKLGDEIEILPGYEVEERNVKIWKPLKTKIMGLTTGGKSVQEVSPGGSIGVLTLLDPSIVKADSLSGTIVGNPGKLPKLWYDLSLETHLLERVVGSKDDLDVSPIKLAEPLMLNVNSSATVGIVFELGKNRFKCKLKRPVCAEQGSRVTISRRVGTRFRLIGYGIIK